MNMFTVAFLSAMAAAVFHQQEPDDHGRVVFESANKSVLEKLEASLNEKQ